MSNTNVGLDLERIIFIGRTFEEYRDIFNVSKEDLFDNKILDCPSGACSFTAIANQLGGDVTAADIAYYHPVESLREKGLQDLEHGIANIEKVKQNYKWDYFETADELHATRSKALLDCTNDMIANPHRYVAATLPQLPFADQQFDLTLSAHFLFMYADRLDLSFHKATLAELMRVTRREIRLFPLVDQTSERSAFVDEMLSFIREMGWSYEIQDTSYEFQRNANQMLVITAAGE
ncbi:methyltransferase domain-containing protein [Paenibacillus lignilyticus]|uniref:Methyltransferase domain-containing protein n=1 Tax=Paenibacillus lignilyticus TaxID=1172615 RepID=A0ABS5CGY2_9BACL|nr:methyltransferase domain-containing protein [Paenibacillus lignilyticus]MBP3965132.1 methyltransferase domain-containing protein [Paenibacillus lignilyticus]